MLLFLLHALGIGSPETPTDLYQAELNSRPEGVEQSLVARASVFGQARVRIWPRTVATLQFLGTPTR